MQAKCFCFRRQGNDVAVVGGEHADWLSVQAGMEYLLYRAEEAVAIDQGPHGGKGSGITGDKMTMGHQCGTIVKRGNVIVGNE